MKDTKVMLFGRALFAAAGLSISFACLAAEKPAVETSAAPRLQSTTRDLKRDPGIFGNFWWANRFLSRHQQIEKLRGRDVDLVMLGDSICHFWEWEHPKSWAKLAAGRTVLNLGYGGDRTENAIWRIEHGELDGYKAGTIVLMIGTNNNSSDTTNPTNVAAGIEKIISLARTRQPKAKIVLHPIFPRGAADSSNSKHGRARKRNEATNALLRDFARRDGNIVFIDFNEKFLDKSGFVPRSLMADEIHPTDLGYDIWLKALADRGIISPAD